MAGTSPAQTPATFDSGGKTVPVEVVTPTTPGKHPAIVIVYGSEGMNHPFGGDIRTFAGELAAQDYLALIPDYFARTGTQAGNETALRAFPQHGDTWVETIDDALTYAAGRADVQSDRIGLLGFSLGGHLALRRAKQDSGAKVDAVVEFFAPISQLGGLGGHLDRLPPTQIHHGLDDDLVKPGQSRELEALLQEEGTRYEIDFYPKERHGFRGATAIRQSTQRSVVFFNNHVK
ncbi:MAG TPA: dienelactone hydrolase family protein [Isosphaeraceae bacterium]|jgi:dienelactone hydrolase